MNIQNYTHTQIYIYITSAFRCLEVLMYVIKLSEVHSPQDSSFGLLTLTQGLQNVSGGCSKTTNPVYISRMYLAQKKFATLALEGFFFFFWFFRSPVPCIALKRANSLKLHFAIGVNGLPKA